MRDEVELSVRLRSLAELVTAGNCVCDVGCDHGFLSIYLVQKGIAPKAIAMDLREGPLSRAREHIRDWGLEDYIETRLSDGVEALEPGEAQSLVCAGMGGRLMKKILAEGREKCEKLRELILQPQSEVKEFRAFLRREGYRIAEEKMVEEDGKFYFLLKAVPGKEQVSERIEAPGIDGRMAEAPGTDGGKAEMPGTDGGMAEAPGTDGGKAEMPGTDGGMAEAPGTDGGKAEMFGTDGGCGETAHAGSSLYDAFGEQLLLRRDPVLRRFLSSREGALEEILAHLEGQAGEKALLRKREIERELEETREALRQFV